MSLDEYVRDGRSVTADELSITARHSPSQKSKIFDSPLKEEAKLRAIRE